MKAVGPNRDQIVWNFRMTRQLILLSTWLDSHYISDEIRADSLPEWKAKSNMLYSIAKLLWTTQRAKEGEAKFTLPDPDDITALLIIVCNGTPKIRSLLKLVAALVIMMTGSFSSGARLPQVRHSFSRSYKLLE